MTTGIIRYGFLKSFDDRQTVTENSAKPTIFLNTNSIKYKSKGAPPAKDRPIMLEAGDNIFLMGY